MVITVGLHAGVDGDIEGGTGTMNSHSKPCKPADTELATGSGSKSNAYPRPMHNPRLKNSGPRNLRLVPMRLPLPALVSILHRISGVLLFLSLPAVWWLFALSLDSAAGYAQALAILASTPVKLLSLGLIWALAHHFLAGLRHLAMDLHLGLELATARLTGKLVLIASLLLTLLIGVALW